jgi:hypothetical protein
MEAASHKELVLPWDMSTMLLTSLHLHGLQSSGTVGSQGRSLLRHCTKTQAQGESVAAIALYTPACAAAHAAGMLQQRWSIL